MATAEPQRYFVVIGAKEIGPFPLELVVKLRSQGKLEGPVRMRPEGGDDLIFLRELLAERRLHHASDQSDPAGIAWHLSSRFHGCVWVVPSLIGLSVLVYLAMGWQGAGWLNANYEHLIVAGANYAPYTMDGEAWRLIAYIFLHGGLIHLLVNMYALFDLGRLAERLFGAWRLLALYLIAGIAGGMTSAWWNPWVNSVGASGAIFGIMGALLAFLLDQRNGVPVSVMKVHAAGILLMIGFTLFYGVAHPEVDNAAHLGGFLAGVVCGVFFSRPGMSSDGHMAVQVRWAAAPVLVAAACLGLFLQTPNHGPTVRSENGFRLALSLFEREEKRLLLAANKILPELEPKLRLGQAVPEMAVQVDALASDWRKLAEELGRPALAPDSHFRGLQRELVENATLRAQFMGLLSSAARYPEMGEILAPRVREIGQAQKANLARLSRIAPKLDDSARTGHVR